MAVDNAQQSRAIHSCSVLTDAVCVLVVLVVNGYGLCSCVSCCTLHSMTCIWRRRRRRRI